MAKKPRRRPMRRRPQDNSQELADRQRWTDAAARTLLANHSPEQLRAELHDRQQLLDEADRVAQIDPNPANLMRYRAARSQLEAAKRAVELAGSRPAEAGDGRDRA